MGETNTPGPKDGKDGDCLHARGMEKNDKSKMMVKFKKKKHTQFVQKYWLKIK